MARRTKKLDAESPADILTEDLLALEAERYDGIEVERDDWEAAERLCKKDDRFQMGPPRGPDRAFKRLYFDGGEE